MRQRTFVSRSALPVLALTAILLGAGTTSTAASSVPRATSDRPDDISGPQLHVLYVVPRDGVDSQLDTNGTIDASVSNFETWLDGQTGGSHLRLDTYQGAPDVTFFRLSETDAAIAGKGLYARDAIERELHAAGIDSPNKIYAVYYDGSDPAICGGGAWPPTLPGNVGAVYLRATYGAGNWPCYDAAQSRSGLQLMDLALLHEMLHVLGFVPTCAPHFTRAGHVSDSPNDLLYAGDANWMPTTLDVGHDDYYGAHIAGCPDLADSLYLTGNEPPAPACVVPRVVGRPLARARRAITRAGCSVGRIKKRRGPKHSVGRVLAQSPRPRTRRPAGAKVSLTVGARSRPRRAGSLVNTPSG